MVHYRNINIIIYWINFGINFLLLKMQVNIHILRPVFHLFTYPISIIYYINIWQTHWTRISDLDIEEILKKKMILRNLLEDWQSGSIIISFFLYPNNFLKLFFSPNIFYLKNTYTAQLIASCNTSKSDGLI